jgi:hypothetical protein
MQVNFISRGEKPREFRVPVITEECEEQEIIARLLDSRSFWRFLRSENIVKYVGMKMVSQRPWTGVYGFLDRAQPECESCPYRGVKARKKG